MSWLTSFELRYDGLKQKDRDKARGVISIFFCFIPLVSVLFTVTYLRPNYSTLSINC